VSPEHAEETPTIDTGVTIGASDAPTEFVELEGRTLAYRSIGSGPEIVWCNRFRGTLDTWDPAFLDTLARHFTVITFDYSGIGQSTGEAPSTVGAMAQDARDLTDELDIENFIIGGWSMGGIAAQVVVARWAEWITHAVLIGTNPAGANARSAEPLFYERARKSENDLDDETVLFFEPKSVASRAAAERTHERLARRRADQDPPVSSAVFERMLQTVGPDIRADAEHVRDALMATSVPILIISGDHDISFPVENWYVLSGGLPTAQHIVFPSAGHGPQHQYPEAAATYIAAFVQTTRAIA
jgi:pimeloyl-ACP methyl ester carboxylesterase